MTGGRRRHCRACLQRFQHTAPDSSMPSLNQDNHTANEFSKKRITITGKRASLAAACQSLSAARCPQSTRRAARPPPSTPAAAARLPPAAPAGAPRRRGRAGSCRPWLPPWQMGSRRGFSRRHHGFRCLPQLPSALAPLPRRRRRCCQLQPEQRRPRRPLHLEAATQPAARAAPLQQTTPRPAARRMRGTLPCGAAARRSAATPRRPPRLRRSAAGRPTARARGSQRFAPSLAAPAARGRTPGTWG